ncbi:MAG: hypothetical protein ACXVCP_18025 [Bdellovibrio sp.]
MSIIKLNLNKFVCGSFSLFIFTFPNFSMADNYDNQNRLMPDTEPYVTNCRMFQALESKESQILFLRHDVVNLDTHTITPSWQENVCPADCSKKINDMHFYKGSEGVEPGYTYDSSFVRGQFLSEKEMKQKIEQAGKVCNKSFADINNTDYRKMFIGAEQDCIKKQTLKDLYTSLNLGSSSKATFQKLQKKDFIDFYQVCYKELHATFFEKAKANIYQSIKNITGKKEPATK